MNKTLTTLLLAGLAINGCSTTDTPTPKVTHVHYKKPTPQKEEQFHKTMMKVALSTKEDDKYNRMALDTPEKKEWFKTLMYRLWDRQITRDQFIAEGIEKYPTHRYEFSFVANGFQKYS